MLDTVNVTQADIDSVTDSINDVYKEAGSSTGIIKTLSSDSSFNKNRLKRNSPCQPWFNKECNTGRKLLYKAKHQCRKKRSEESEATVKFCGKKYKAEIKQARNSYNKEVHKKLRNLKSSNPKDYWAIINKNDRKAASKISTQILFEHFKKLNQNSSDSTSESETESDEPSAADMGDNSPFNLPFIPEEIQKHTPCLKNGKACGLDAISNEFIKYSPRNMIDLLTKYFNLILETGLIPSDWCNGVIISIYKKKGDVRDPDNYRGITLLSCVGKLFTVLLNSRLSQYLESNRLLGEEQAGFRPGYSTLDHIFTLYCIIDLYVSKKRRLYAAFVDYRKAFDTVDRHHLWQKLISLGISGKILNVIKNMYSRAKSCIQNGNEVSDFFSCNIGVRQGENLSPLLFSIFLNDLSAYLGKDSKGIQVEFSVEGLNCYIKLFALLYADDTILLSESPVDLQSMLHSLKTYCDQWKLQVNTSKTKIVIFSRGLVRKPPDFNFGEHRLEIVSDYVYLGITFNFNGRFTKAMNKQIAQAKRATYSIVAKARRMQLPLDIQLHLFDTCILPILLYGSEVWGFSNLKDMEIFHNQFCKHILRIGTRSINNIAIGELGRFKIEKYVKQRMLNFWVKINHGESGRISKAIYIKMRELYDSGEHKSSWIECIHSTLKDLDLEYLWDATPEQLPINSMKVLFDQKLQTHYLDLWETDISGSSACDNYAKFKTALKIEDYLLLLEPRQAIPLVKFRANNHKLPIVTGRYNNTPREERICNLCSLQSVGDEHHYLLCCEYFRVERERYIDQVYTANPNISNYKSLMGSSDIQELVNLSTFVSVILKQFSQ